MRFVTNELHFTFYIFNYIIVMVKNILIDYTQNKCFVDYEFKISRFKIFHKYTSNVFHILTFYWKN